MRTKDNTQGTPSMVISGGDPAGVGPYLITYALKHKLLPEKTWIVVHQELLEYWFQELYGHGIEGIENVEIISDLSAEAKVLEQLHNPIFTGKVSYEYLTTAIEIAYSHKIPLLTMPINKTSWGMAGIPLSGHTDYFRDKFPEYDPIMAMKHKNLFVIAITDHIPLREVGSMFNKRRWVKKRLIHILAELSKFAGIKKVAITGLNPHAGETPMLGTEEHAVIKPFIRELNFAFPMLDIEGPFPADSFWGMGKWKEYDAILAPYHDQAFIPFKMVVEGKKGIHITLGLPFLRVSPIHGTAYEAIKNRNVNVDSFIECIEFIKNYGNNNDISEGEK